VSLYGNAQFAWIVRRLEADGPVTLSAWPDEYAAKYEASRWEQDSKMPHDYIEGILLVKVKEEVDGVATEEPAAASVL
jgi:hypothetical protein